MRASLSLLTIFCLVSVLKGQNTLSVCPQNETWVPWRISFTVLLTIPLSLVGRLLISFSTNFSSFWKHLTASVSSDLLNPRTARGEIVCACVKRDNSASYSSFVLVGHFTRKLSEICQKDAKNLKSNQILCGNGDGTECSTLKFIMNNAVTSSP